MQSFTPILGTLLLSPNGLVGGPARFAVVELLNRARRADAKDRRESKHHEQRTPGPSDSSNGQREGRVGVMAQPNEDSDEEDSYSPTDLFGPLERRLFEREMVQQVVIGMGRLDLPDENAASEAQDEEAAYAPGIPTTVPAAHAHHTQDDQASYFPATNLTQSVPPAGNNTTFSPTAQPPASSPSSSLLTSPHSSATASPSSIHSVPSLTSADSPSSRPGSESSSQLPITPPNFLPPASLASEDTKIHKSSPLASPMFVEEDDLPTPDAWNPPHVTSLLSPRPQSPHFVGSPPHVLSSASPLPPSPRPPSPRPPSPTSSDTTTHSSMQSYAAEPGSIEQTPYIPDIASPEPQPAHGLMYHTLQDSADLAALQQSAEDNEAVDEAQLSEEASVGRLSSMSLMAAVTASGESSFSFPITQFFHIGICFGWRGGFGYHQLHLVPGVSPCARN